MSLRDGWELYNFMETRWGGGSEGEGRRQRRVATTALFLQANPVFPGAQMKAKDFLFPVFPLAWEHFI